MFPSHGIGSRKDLPLPFEFVLIGAAIALVLTFAVAYWAWRIPRWRQAGGRPLPALTRLVDSRAVRVAAAVVGCALCLWFGVALYLGEDRLTNPAFGWIFACWWVGLVPVSLLAGPAWRALHPLWALASLARWRGFATMPASLGVWPAAVGLAAFGWLELVQPDRATQPVLGIWVGAYWFLMAASTLVFGRDFLERCDPFIVYSTLVSTLSGWQRINGVIHLVNPLRHLATAIPARGSLAVVTVLLATTAFDSAAGGSPWISFTQKYSIAPVVSGTLGLLGFIAVIAVTMAVAVYWLRRSTTGPIADAVAATMVPIVAGYSVGHYTSLLVLEGQRTWIYASDPLGRGWNVFGTAELGVWSGWLDYPVAVALIQLSAIVVGHVIAVVAAHELCLTQLPRESRLWPQLPLLAVMVFYTVAGLGLLFAA